MLSWSSIFFFCHDYHLEYKHEFLKLQLSLARNLYGGHFKRARRFLGTTADRKTIMNYYTRGQTGKNIMDYHAEFERAQNE